MSVRGPFGDARRDELDDELLDRIGRGEHVDTEAQGEVERMLAGWRAGMPTAGAADDRLLDAVTAAITRPPRRRRAPKLTAAAAATVVLAAGGVTAVAAQAGPGSPLWPVTELVFAGRAESRAAVADADHALADARTAVDQGRIPEANRLLAEADEHAAKVEEPAAADRLRDDIESVRDLLRQDTAQTRTHATPEQAPTSKPAPTTDTLSPPAETPPVDPPTEQRPGNRPVPAPEVPLPVDPPGLTEPGGPRSGKPVDPPGPLDGIIPALPR